MSKVKPCTQPYLVRMYYMLSIENMKLRIKRPLEMSKGNSTHINLSHEGHRESSPNTTAPR